MKILWLALGAFCLGFAGCKKNNNTVATAIPVGGTSPVLFVPHIDTFSGAFQVKIGEGGYTDSSSKITDVFVNHYDSTHFSLTSNCVTTNYYDDATGIATFGQWVFTDSAIVNTTNVYSFHPYSHRYDGIRFSSDSVYLNITSEPGSCLFNQLQTFAGKKYRALRF